MLSVCFAFVLLPCIKKALVKNKGFFNGGFLLRQGYAGRDATPFPPLSPSEIEMMQDNILFHNKQKPHINCGVKGVAPAGIEPATQGFSVPCSTD